MPPGIRPCGIEELIGRFGIGSPEREVETQEILEFLAWAQRAGVQRVIVNGSYVTAKVAPNDADIVILPGVGYPRTETPCSLHESRWPFLQIFVAIDAIDLERWSLKDFGTDRNRRKKGVVEVLL